MPNIKFYINTNKKDKNGFIPVKANIAFKNKNHWKTITKIKETDKWLADSQRIDTKGKIKEKDRKKEVNELLQNYENKTDDFFKNCLLKDVQITEKLIIEFLNGEAFIKNNNIDIDSIFLTFIESAKKEVSMSTEKKYTTVKRLLINYQKYANLKLTFTDINDSFFEDLKAYAVNEKKLQPNTIFTYFAIICQFFRWAKIRKYYSGTAHENIKAPSSDITFVSLSLDELKKLFYFQFPTKRLNQVRDVFCFGCLTGLRRGDLILLQREHIKGKFLYITLQKSPIEVIIPLVSAAQKILDRCDDPQRLFLKISHNGYLIQLKKCCEIAELDEMILKTKYIGTRRFDEFKPKHKLITGHTSRKTFVSLSYTLGVPESTIFSITGHQDGSRIKKKYLRIDPEIKLEHMEKAWRKLYEDPNNPNTEDNQLTEIEKLKKEIEDLKKIVELQAK